LLRRDFRVIIGAAGRPLDLLKREFPACEAVEFPAYDIRYSRKHRILGIMLRQLPRMFRAARAEQRLLNRLIDQRRIHGVISCSRFGLGSRRIPSVYLTHQIQILAPPGWRMFEPLLRLAHDAIRRTYTETWISDFPGECCVAGRLTAQGQPLPRAAHIGTLSRFSPSNQPPAKSAGRFEILAILSGPEPQRAIFEALLTEHLKGCTRSSLIVRGVTESVGWQRRSDHLTLTDSLTAEELQPLMEAADVIISRTGYSTVMDLLALGRTAILTPTPGQTEQEYLGQSLRRKGRFHVESQAGFDLQRGLKALENQPHYPPVSLLSEVLYERIEALFGRSMP